MISFGLATRVAHELLPRVQSSNYDVRVHVQILLFTLEKSCSVIGNRSPSPSLVRKHAHGIHASAAVRITKLHSSGKNHSLSSPKAWLIVTVRASPSSSIDVHVLILSMPIA